MALTKVYKCADGTDFPVTWDDPADAELTWISQRDHYPRPVLPIERSAGFDPFHFLPHVFEEAKLPVPSLLPRMCYANGHRYAYIPAGGGPLSGDQEIAVALSAFMKEQGGPRGVWDRYCLPRLQACCRLLEEADSSADPMFLMETRFKGFAWTALAIRFVNPRFVELSRFLASEVGDEAILLTQELQQGYQHETQTADRALWEVAQAVRSSPALLRALESEPDTFHQRLMSDDSFSQRFGKFIEAYGDRAEDWDISAPTYREHPEVALSLIRLLALGQAQSPDDALADAALRRQVAIERIATRLNDEKGREFLGMVENIADRVPIVEGRAHWQLTLIGLCRQALLRVGERLRSQDIIKMSDDILFMEVDEVRKPPEDIVARIASRRVEHERQARIVPPPFIGAEPPADMPAPPMGAGMPTEVTDPKVVTGVAASRGLKTGRARLLRDPSEADRLAQDEVLITVTTAPPWTPLFAIAGAVVTETGGILSHTAITAREYGIPCVVAAHAVMSRIPDGALVTVDGSKGEVHLAE